MKRLCFAATLVLSLALLLSACGAPAPAPLSSEPTRAIAPTIAAPVTESTAPVPGSNQNNETKVLRIGVTTYPDVIDPQKSSIVGEVNVLQLAYEGLLRLDERGLVQPGASDHWKSSPDGKTISFHLRDGLKRSDGTPMSCADFEYALKREVDPFTPGRLYSGLVMDIQGASPLLKYGEQTDLDKMDHRQVDALYKNYGVRCLDSQTLEIEFNSPIGFWEYIASTWVTFPTDRRSVEKDPDKWWTKAGNHVGNGPFKITEIEQDKRIVLEANPNYWGGRPKLDRIEFIYQADSKKMFRAYQDGELEMVAAAPEWLDEIQATPILRASLVRYPSAKTLALAFNNSRRPFDDRNVRVAFSQAFDREGWAREVYKNTLQPYTRWIPPGVPGAQPDQVGVPNTDPASAVKTLTENGYAAVDSTPQNPKVDCAKLGELRLTFSASPTNQARYQFIAGNFLHVIGCPILLDPVDPTVYSALMRDVKTQPQMLIQGWIQDYPHPQNWLSVYWVCGTFAEHYGYCNPTLDKMLQEADQTTEFEKAIKKYQAAEDLLLGDVPAAFAGYAENLFLVAPYLVGPAQHLSSSDGVWAGNYGPILNYDVDLSRVPANYPKK